MIHGSVVHELMRRAGNISVHVIAGEEISLQPPHDAVQTAEPVHLDLGPYGMRSSPSRPRSAVGLLIRPWLGIENVDLVFLTAIVGIAVRFGLWPSLFASVIASLGYNFFFMQPVYTFTIADPTNVGAFFFFIIMAALVSNVAARVRTQAVAAMDRARTTEVSLQLQPQARRRRYAGRRTLGHGLSDRLDAEGPRCAAAARRRLDSRQGRVIRLKIRCRRPTLRPPNGRSKATGRPGAVPRHCRVPSGCFCRCRTSRGIVGIMGIDSDKQGALLTPDQRRLLDALIDQGALAIERVHLVEEMDRAKRAIETDRLRSALLTSISHDLKTPLAAILGSAGTIRDLGASLSDAQKSELLTTIVDESERLNRFIANLLDMTKLESGALALNMSPHDLSEIVGSALRRAGKILSGHRVELDLSADVPMVELDAVLFEQVLFNVLDNAAKYAPEHSAIRIRSWRDRGCRSHRCLR